MPWHVPRTSCHPTISVDRAPECPALGNPFHSVRGSDLAAIPGMATVHRLPTRIDPGPEESILGRLLTLAKLELELGLAETRDVLVSAAIAVAVGIPASVLLLTSLVVLIAAAFAPIFGARWEHLVIAGGGIGLVACVPLLQLVGTGARVVQAGLAVATTVSTVNRFIAERPEHRKAA